MKQSALVQKARTLENNSYKKQSTFSVTNTYKGELQTIEFITEMVKPLVNLTFNLTLKNENTLHPNKI